jgi:hypothetical protein
MPSFDSSPRTERSSNLGRPTETGEVVDAIGVQLESLHLHERRPVDGALGEERERRLVMRAVGSCTHATQP